MKKIVLTTLTFLGLFSSATAQSHVWEVSKGNDKLFLGGTIHALRSTDFPLPEAYNQAFEKAETLVFETDMEVLKTPEFAQKMMAQAVYADRSTLKDHLKPETFAEFEKYCESSGIPLAMLQSFKPFMAVTMITGQKIMQLGFQPGGIDQFFYDKATSAKKPITYFETPDEQIAILLNSGAGNEDAMMLKFIEDLRDMETILNQLVEALKNGNAKHLSDEIAKFETNYPKVYATLLKERNDKWLAKIPEYFNTKEVELVLVGAMHLYGEDGLLEALKNQGYQITSVK
ncbi:TraB/GumN family protein [Aquimarina agarivorans]|uniref:TraB/GumN family protein n=1 Tax=Aquimarina agarivorans TaxID=980584 RepID=UPI000248EA69|nr:TraB/GumN family protein [Aquimarina agarivorans]